MVIPHKGKKMKTSCFSLAIIVCVLSSCNGAESKTQKKATHLATLICNSPREALTQEEMQVIGDRCFLKGNYSKSTGQKW